jgi:hypothetical protein
LFIFEKKTNEQQGIEKYMFSYFYFIFLLIKNNINNNFSFTSKQIKSIFFNDKYNIIYTKNNKKCPKYKWVLMIMNSIPKQGKTQIMKITNIPKTTQKNKGK